MNAVPEFALGFAGRPGFTDSAGFPKFPEILHAETLRSFGVDKEFVPAGIVPVVRRPLH